MPAPKEDELLPSDGVVIKQVLDSMGIKEYEPRVVHQLLDFMYRNVAEVLHVAEAFSDRAGSVKREIGMEDVMLAIQAKATTSFVTPPSQDALQLMADRRNKIALPAIATKYGFRLPPPEDCLIAPNFQFHPHNAPENMDWEEDPIPAGIGTEPTKGPPARGLKDHVHDMKAQHPAFRPDADDAALDGSGGSHAAEGLEKEAQAVTDTQS